MSDSPGTGSSAQADQAISGVSLLDQATQGDGFGDFIAAGDAAFEDSAFGSPAVTSPAVTLPAVTSPDGASSNTAPGAAPARSSQLSSPIDPPADAARSSAGGDLRQESANPSPAQRPGSPGFSIQGFFQNVSRSFENTLENAKREIGRNEVLTAAGSNVGSLAVRSFSNISATAAGLAGDDSPRNQAPASRAFGAGLGANLEYLADRDAETTAMRPFHLNTCGRKLLLAFLHPDTQCLVMVTDEKLLYLPLLSTPSLEVLLSAALSSQADEEMDGDLDDVDGRSGSSALPAPRESTCAAYLAATDEIVVGRSDGSLALYSTNQGNPGSATRATTLPGPATYVPVCVRALESRPTHFAVGCRDGCVVVLAANELSIVRRVAPPGMCAGPVGLPDTPVSCVSCAFPLRADCSTQVEDSCRQEDVKIAVGYQDGGLSTTGNDTVDTVAHCDDVTACAQFLGGLLVASIGSEVDPSVSITDTSRGRCVGRRALPYTPTAIALVHQRCESYRIELSDDEIFNPASMAFLIGGNEGQVDLMRLVVLSLSRVEIRLISRLSERIRGKDVGVEHFVLDVASEIIVAVARGGSVRRWRLGVVEARAVLRPTRIKPVSLLQIISSPGETLPPVDSRLSAGDEIVAAQHILATVLQDDCLGIEEDTKDVLVEDFQNKQSHMCEAGGRADKELWRAKNRIQRRFSKGIIGLRGQKLSNTDCAMQAAILRTVSFEQEFASARHREHISKIQLQAISRLQGALLLSLRGAQGDVSKIVETKNAIHALLK